MCFIFQVALLSSEYYHLVPKSGYAYEKIQPIDKSLILNRERGIVHNLLDYVMAAKMLAGAQYRLKGKLNGLKEYVTNQSTN